MGEDFNYQDATMWFKNLDKLIKYGNELKANGSRYHFIYSTPSCYLKSLHESNEVWPVETEDFFPYASDPTAVWTGYFTSRPTVKRYERMGNHFLQVCKQLTALAFLKNFAKRVDPRGGKSFTEHLTFLRQEMGVMQHHDAVTGTEKQHVANDYIRSMYIGLKACNYNTKLVLNELTKPTDDEIHVPELLPKRAAKYLEYETAANAKNYTFGFESCHLLNISRCDVSEKSERFMVTAYNPLAHTTFQYVRFPVPHSNYRVMDYRKVAVQFQVIPISGAFHSQSSDANFEITFMAQEVPALGYKSYFVESLEIVEKDDESPPSVHLLQRDSPQHDDDDVDNGRELAAEEIVTIGNAKLKASFSRESGLLQEIVVDGKSHAISQSYLYYPAAVGRNHVYQERSSGAYIFRPNGSEQAVSPKPATIAVIRGDIVDEVYQVFNDWVYQVVRIYHDNSTVVEFEWTVGPIPIHDYKGKEVVSRFSSAINSAGIFYTDSNGREMLKRKRNDKPLFRDELVAINYYPITTKIALEDESTRMAVLTDRAQGGSSLSDGNIEVMVHRRLLADDAFGVGEALNEAQYGKGLVANGKLYLVIGSKGDQTPTPAATERFVQNQKLVPNWMFFSRLQDIDYADWMAKYKNIGSMIMFPLPQNVYLMSLEPWRENGYLVRFEHILEKNEDSNYSKPVSFNLTDVFGPLFDIASVRETNLAANQWIQDKNRFKFQSAAKSNEIKREAKSMKAGVEIVEDGLEQQLEPDDSNKYTVTLGPMQIRTFIITTNEQL